MRQSIAINFERIQNLAQIKSVSFGKTHDLRGNDPLQRMIDWYLANMLCAHAHVVASDSLKHLNSIDDH